jgi:hypothetical protein
MEEISIMRRIMHAGAIALAANLAFASFATAQTMANFTFTYDSSYSDQGLSQPYAATTTTGQSYGSGVAIEASDANQHVYSLVEANPNIGVGGLRGGFPADSRTIAVSSSTPGDLGPYSIVRRASDGTIDSEFGDNGYVSDVGNSADSSYKFTSLCIDPGTGSAGARVSTPASMPAVRHPASSLSPHPTATIIPRGTAAPSSTRAPDTAARSWSAG